MRQVQVIGLMEATRSSLNCYSLSFNARRAGLQAGRLTSRWMLPASLQRLSLPTALGNFHDTRKTLRDLALSAMCPEPCQCKRGAA